MIVKAPEIIPRQEDGSAAPERFVVHDGVDLLHRPVLPRADALSRMIAILVRLYQPADGWKITTGGVFGELSVIGHMLLPLATVANRIDGIIRIPFVAIFILERGILSPGDAIGAQEVTH